MLTAEGAAWLWQLASASGLQIVVSDGTQEASVPAEVRGIVQDEGSATLTLECIFGAEVANFDWSRREVRAGDVVIDVEEKDRGRKAQGAEWSMEVAIELEGESG